MSTSWPTPPPAVGDQRRARRHLLPHHPIGWWTVVALLVTGAYPLYFSALGHAVHPYDIVRISVAAVLATVSLLLSRQAILQRKDPAVLVVVIFWVVAFEVVLGVLFGLALLGQAL